MDMDQKSEFSQNSDSDLECNEDKVLISATNSLENLQKIENSENKVDFSGSHLKVECLTSDSVADLTEALTENCTDNVVIENEKSVQQNKEINLLNNTTANHDQKEELCNNTKEKPKKSNTCENCGQALQKEVDKNVEKTNTMPVAKSASSLLNYGQSTGGEDFCRICHCEGDSVVGPLIAPCNCKGTLEYIHQSCLQQWIKSSDYRHCELCGFHFAMNTKLKPIMKWEKLSMSTSERRKIVCSVMFHIIAITCVIWSLHVLIERTAGELKEGKLQWPFWTKLVVVAIGFTGGLVFMYVQCKVYVLLWKRLKAFNRIIYVQDQPSKSSGSLHKQNLPQSVPSNSNINYSSDNIQPTSSQEDFVVVVEICEQQESRL